MSAVESLGLEMPLTRACAALGLSRASVYRARQETRPDLEPVVRRRPGQRLSDAERERIHQVLNQSEHVDKPPRAVYAKLLDEGIYLCHWRTMYRVLAQHGEVRERRAQRPPQAHVRPELVATAPKQVWSWDITKLKGPVRGQFFFLYVILDIFSRYVVGWMAAEREGEDLARQLVAQTAAKEDIDPGTLTLHADRGSPMIAGAMGDLLQSLGIAKSHSRPRVSNDNPFSEAQFKTVKYRPAYPGRFRDQDHVLAWARETFQWYNHEHAHSSLALLTPAVVHAGLATSVLANRQAILDQAFLAHPERFPAGRPSSGSLPETVWINEPALDLQATASHSRAAPKAPLSVPDPTMLPDTIAMTFIPESAALQ